MSPIPAQPGSSRARWVALLSMAVIFLLAFLLYGRALNFGFFNDDPTGHFAWMESRAYGDYFRTSADYGYYRPVVFVVLQSLVDAVAYDARIFHALLLGLHAANAALLWLLTWRFRFSMGYAWAAALIFAFAPFNYEAIAYVASLTHPLLLFWLLLTLLLYQQARRISESKGLRRFVYYGLAMITFLLGLLTHENGLLIPLALVGVEWLERRPTGLLDAVRRPFLPYLAVIPVFLFLWWSIPKTSEQALPSLADLFSNWVPFLQTLSFPLLPLFDLTAAQTGALVGLSILTLVLTFLAARAAKALDLWLFGLGWIIFSALPATLFLSPDYLYGSPRLHYLPSVGVAILWAMPVLALAKHLPEDFWQRLGFAAVGLVYTLAIILPPTIFISCELDFYDEASRIVRRMGDLSEEAADGRDLLFVNLPIFFSSYAEHPEGCRNPYPWTPVGAVIVPDYANARDFVRFNGGENGPASAVTVDAYAPGWHTFGNALDPDELRERLLGEQIYVYDLIKGDFFDLSAAWLTSEAGAGESLALFGDALRLNSADIKRSAEDELAVSLSWQNTKRDQDGVSPTVFVHIYAPDGSLVAQHDSAPANGFVPYGWWIAGDTIHDVHRVELGDDVPPGNYRVAVGLYNPQTAERYAASAGEVPLADDVFIAGELVLP